MSGSKSDYLELAVLNHFTGKSSTTAPTTYLALLTVVPTDASTGATITEATFTSYARTTIAAGGWNSASAGSISNSGTITPTAPTGGSSTIIALALLDSATIGAGNLLWWMSCASTVVSSTQAPSVAAGAIVISED